MKVLESPTTAQRYNLLGVAKIVNRWKYLVLGLTIAAALISAIAAKMLPNVYKSTAVFYPTNLTTADPDRVVGGDHIELFAKTEDIDRVITIGESMPVAEYIIEKFDLYTHYGFDTARTDQNKQWVLDEFLSNYSIAHNPRDAIEVTYFDEDKTFAARIANAIVDRIDHVNQQLTYENRKKAMEIYKARYDFMAKDYNLLRDSLSVLRRQFGVYDMGHMAHNASKYLTEELVKTETGLQKSRSELQVLSKSYPASNPKVIDKRAEIAGLENAYLSLKGESGDNLLNIESYLKGADVINNLVVELNGLTGPYIEAKMQYDNALLSLNESMSTIYIVQKAIPATKKAKPVRWLIVVASTFITFFLSIILISFFELYRRQVSANQA